ncbi:MAG: gliding motility protein GldC [Schleiferiaceae bacterium]|jgi:gliding motility-associated protein GldC
MKSTIHLDIELDENRVPERIQWSAPDGGVDQAETPAVMLSVWDERAEELLRIDLWTKDMRVDHMKKMYHQMLLALADGLERATSEAEAAEDLRIFARHFAERLKLMDPAR